VATRSGKAKETKKKAAAPGKAGAKAPAKKSSGRGTPANGTMTVAGLRKIPAFAGLSVAEATAMLDLMTERPLARGEPVFREGTVGDGLYVVLEGSVSITRKNEKGGDREVAVLTENEVLGEMDLISDRPHTSGAKGAQGSRLLFLPKKGFQDLLRAGNQGAISLVMYFTRMLAGRLDANNKRMMAMLDARKQPASSEFADFKRRLLQDWTF